MSSVPVSQYEALRAEMRSLVQQTQQVHEIATQVISIYSNSSVSSANYQIRQDELEQNLKSQLLDLKMESLVLDNVQLKKTPHNIHYEGKEVEGETPLSEDECGRVPSTTQMSVSSEPISQPSRPMNALYHGTWPVERTMWNSEPNNLSPEQQQHHLKNNMDQQSVLSFASSSGGAPLDRVLGSPEQLSRKSMQQFEAKVDMVYSLLAMLGGQEHADMGDTLLALSTSPESCLAMRQSGCIPLLVQLVQSDKDLDTRKKASQALHNLVHAQPDERLRKRETRVLKLLEQARKYTEALKNNTDYEPDISSSTENQENSDQNDKHPVLIIANLMKHSFDEGHRQAICQLGGIHIIASLVETEHALHGSVMDSASCILLRRYACMALTNLTFGDSGNKALLCSFREFMRALVVQLQSPSDELRQVTASVLRNLSWRADPTSKEILREVGTVTGLMKAGMATGKENTLKSILSALWNLSAHCTENKLEICAVEGGLGFLVDMLSYKAPSKSLSINENAGGILRNISSQIAVRDDYREILRKFNCLQILLEQLKSPSLTIVSNACGTLWNLSAKNQVDQEALWQMGAPAMLRSLNHSKHKMIATGSSAALKNLLNSRPSHSLLPQMDSTARAMDLPVLPTLGARKQKALMRDLDQNLSETFENIERDSPTKLTRDEKLLFERTEKFSGSFLNKRTRSGKNVVRSESHEFVSHNDLVYESRTTRSEASNQGELCNGFASLNLNEPSTSYQKELRNSSGTRISGQYSGSSLVYVNQAQRKGTYIPLRNNYTDEYSDDIDSAEQPIDYGRKYSETKLPGASKPQFPPATTTKEPKKETTTKPIRKDSNYGIYAETDLDQPTDYSLRYAEDDSDDEDICDKIRQKDGTEFEVQDTLKTYCTEGTPYETPLNFSNATSMSDLRIDAEKTDIDNDKNKDKDSKVAIPTLSHLDEKDHCSVEDISELDNNRKSNEKPLKSELSSGLMTPEKPVNYCDEGTPGYFSRVSSFGSLNSIPVNETEKAQQVETVSSEVAKDVEEKVDTSPTEAKAVKFVEPTVNYAEQTPLMFSRSSSLASLDSVEQHSIHDDRSSVISDFSRLTSGIVSPSELPDSPTQTVPPSPRPRKGILEYPSTSRNGTGNFLRGPDGRPQPAPRTLHKPSVFEDNITKFKEESTPIQFSTATSISSLTIDDQDEPVCGDLKNATPSESCNGTTVTPREEGVEKQDTEQEKRDSSSEFNEQLSENDEDDDILADCINIGMQNNRHRQSKTSSPPTSRIPAFKPAQRPQGSGIPLPRKGIPTRCAFPQQAQRPKPTPVNSDTLRTYCTEDTPAVLSQAGSNSDLSVLSIQTDNKSKKDYLSDDSSNLSGDNDNILAECIQSGMPKAKVPKDNVVKRQIPSRKLQTSTPIKPFTRNEHFEEKKRFVSGYLAAKDEVASFAVENSPCQFSLRSSLSDLTVDGSVAGLTRTLGEGETEPTTSQGGDLKPGPSLHSTGNESLISRRESLSSLSVESFGSMETEQALLEQCISSGMPKSKNVPCAKPAEKEKPIGVATKHFNAQKTTEMEQCRRQEENDKSSKNASAASVVGNTKLTRAKSPEIPATATDVDTEKQKIGLALKIKTDHHGTGHSQQTKTIDPEIKADTSPDRSSPTDVNLSTGQTKNGSETKALDCSLTASTYSNSDNCQNLSGIKNIVDNRMLDPEAMIESLDRFTAELVSQASSHLQNKEENKYATSVTDGDTWNDDTSPNDITFPSISGSPPNVITFDSESAPYEKPADEVDGLKSNDFSSSTLTESTLIAMEATKMATTFQQEAELSLSVASLELDQVQPPSQMNSLTSSAFDCVRKSPKLVTRKRSLPAGLMVKRALNNSLCQGSSLESLENNSLSNLDHINPPSAMADLLDMEGSMVSVASLSSEIGDFQLNGKVTEKFQQPNPIFNVKQPANMLHLLTHSSNLSDNLENVNPPSIFNEITDMCNSLADVETENIDTELFEDCNTLQTENDATEIYSDANSITPIQSDVSSTETTPKKVKTLSRQLTPKQKRILLKERYKTYTVAAEMMRGEQDHLMDSKEDDTESEDFKTVACHTESYKTVQNYSTATYTRSPSKTTPKERRQNDPARFQTQVLDKTVTELLQLEATPSNSDSNNSNNNSPHQSPAKSRISIRRNFTQKRLENKDRFKTQTITESSISPSPSPTDLHYLLQKEANMVLKTLSETKSKPDEFLDCETISLVSNEDDSEHNSGSSNCRTHPKSLSNGPSIPVVQKTIPSRISSESNATEEEIEVEEKTVNINYGTYRKSWSNGPKVEGSPRVSSDLENYQPEEEGNSESEEEEKPLAKPKITKPSEKKIIEEVVSEEGKGIRGRRKPLYSKANANNKMTGKSLKPIKSVTSNLVKNVSSTLKSSANIKVAAKPPPVVQTKGLKPPTNYTKPKSTANSPKGSPVRTVNNKSPKHNAEPNKSKPVIERQGTFTKEDKTVKSKIPSAIPKTTSRIAKAIPVKSTSKIQTFASSNSVNRTGLVKSASTDRANKPSPTRLQNRSPSADSRTQKPAQLPPLPKKDDKKPNGNPSSKQITSRIASLWKKVEESKKQPAKKDTRVWIQNEENLEATTSEDGRLVRSNTFEGKAEVILRSRTDEVDETKRVSRLGSFLVVDEDDINGYNQYESPEMSF